MNTNEQNTIIGQPSDSNGSIANQTAPRVIALRSDPEAMAAIAAMNATIGAAVKPSTQTADQMPAFPANLPLDIQTKGLPVPVPAAVIYVNSLVAPELRACLQSQDINDIANACSALENQNGKADFVIAMTLYVIWNKKRYLAKGYDTWQEFCDSLPEHLRMSRQSYMNYVYAGEVLVKTFYFFEYGFSKNPGVDISFLHGNFAKLPILHRYLHRENTGLTSEMFEHFKKDSLAEFKAVTADKRSRKTRAPAKRKAKDEIIQPLSGPKRAITEMVRRGHVPGFIIDHDAIFASHVAFRLKARIHENDAFRLGHAFSESLFDGRDPGILIPRSPQACILALEEYLEKMSLEGLLTVMTKQIKTKTDLQLLKGYIIYRLRQDAQLRDQLPSLGVATVEEFAAKYLNLDGPTYKWLSRSAKNFVVYAELFGKDIDFSYQDSLEKLFYLETAIKNHLGHEETVIEMFRRLSTAKFRNYAKDRNYDPAKDLEVFSESVLLRAQEYFLEYDGLIANNHRVEVLELRLKDERRILDWITRTFEDKERKHGPKRLMISDATTAPSLLGYSEPRGLPSPQE